VHPVIYAADIGSITSGNFGWARIDPEQGSAYVERNDGTEIAELVDAVAFDLDVESRSVALGFECPLFVPVPEDPFQLGAARVGEGNRPFSGGPGTAALVTGLVQTAWILRALRDRCPEATAFLDWDEFSRAGRGLYLWEAFVTGKAKGAAHVDDALIAASTFRESLPDPPAANAVEADNPLSLVGAALLWSGWSQGTALLHKPCLVIKASPTIADNRVVEEVGETAMPKRPGPATSLRDKVIEVAEQIPYGSWTSYGCIAKMIDAIAIGVGGVVGAGGIPNEHRILNYKGKFPEGAPASHLDLLKAEGVRFVNGCADPRQKWQPEPLFVGIAGPGPGGSRP
jgi:alkylated DNA nucleotide flippase Atl1